MKPYRIFYPLLFAAFPILSLYSSNMGLIGPGEIVVPLLIALGIVGLLWLVLGLISRSVWRGALAAAAVSAAYFAFGHVWVSLRGQEPPVDKGLIVTIWWIVVLLIVACILFFTRKARDRVSGAMNVTGVVLVAAPCLSMGLQWMTARQEISKMEASAKTASSPGAASESSLPDIYYIVLDGFGRQDSLLHYMDLDTAPFLGELEKRGFYIARQAHPNYVQTELSLASSLNMDYLPALIDDLNPNTGERWKLDRLIDHNRVSSDLKARGYRYIAIGSGFPGVNPRSADLFLVGAKGASLFVSALVDMSPLPDVSFASVSQYTQHYERIKAAFHAIATLGPGGLRPRFVFVHILSPHPPFVFNADGSFHKQSGPFGFWDASDFVAAIGSRDLYREGYRAQAQALTKMVIVAVDDILRQSVRPPVILIQGDHGSKMDLVQDSLEQTDLRECMRNLSAYLVPDSVKRRLYPEITPVNSFRAVFDGLFNADLPLLKDRSYFSPWNRPFQFIEVSDRIEAPFDRRYP